MSENKIWTVTQDYFATGEGRTLMAWIGYAESEEEALKKFGERFNPYYTPSMGAQKGFVRDDVVSFVFSEQAISVAVKNLGQCNLEMFSAVHFNFS